MSDSDSSDTMGERIGGSGLRLWVLVRMNRWLLTGTVLLAVYVALVATSTIGLAPLRQIVADNNGTFWIFSAFIGAIITGTSIVVTINQLVLSQELGAVGDQRERMDEAMDFRKDLEDEIEEAVSPPEPAGFLYEVLDGVQEQANALSEAVEDERDEEFQDKIDGYVDDLTENAQAVEDELEDAQFGTFDVIWNVLNFDYSRKIFEARQIRADHADSLSEESDEAIDDTIELLKFFGPAREHFKTLYFQWELINLSRALLYIAVPALTVMGTMLMYVDATTLPGKTAGIDNLVWVTSAGFVVGLSPFVVFISFILRIATVAKRTLAMGPFILRESERDSDLG